MTISNLNKSTKSASSVVKQTVTKATSLCGVLVLTLSIVAGSHAAAIASTERLTAGAAPSSNLHAQMSGGSMGNQMGRSKMKNMKRSKMRNRMSRSKMGNNMGGNMRTGKK